MNIIFVRFHTASWNGSIALVIDNGNHQMALKVAANMSNLLRK